MKKVLIAVPTNRNVETATMKSIYDLEIPRGVETELQFFYGYQIDQVRNLIAEWGKRYDYVLHVDSDIILPRDTLMRFIESGKDIISGLYIQRKENEHILEVYQDRQNGGVENIPYWAIENLGVIPIAACGFGCVLVKGDVYRNMKYPHFLYSSAIDHANTISEDIYFANKAREAGYTLWADTNLLCDHVGSTSFKVLNSVEDRLSHIAKTVSLPEEHSDYLFDMKISQGIRPKVIYDLGACVGHWSKSAMIVWPNSEYFMVDATPAVEKQLANLKGEYAIALLSDEDNKNKVFWKNDRDPGGNSYFKENTGAYDDSHRTEMSTITIDTLAKENDWPLPDLIKMDVQGAEIDVLKGAENTLKNVDNIILEAQHIDYNSGAPKIEDVVDYLKDIGFELVENFFGGPNSGNADGDYHFKRINTTK